MIIERKSSKSPVGNERTSFIYDNGDTVYKYYKENKDWENNLNYVRGYSFEHLYNESYKYKENEHFYSTNFS